MKEIKNFKAEKYKRKGFPFLKKSAYKEIAQGIYAYNKKNAVIYVTSLSFAQEPEYEEGEYADDISQYPLEDILENYSCYVSDLYHELNVTGSEVCYLEFASPDIEDIKNLRTIIGKHVYNRNVEENGEIYVELVVE